MQPLPLSPIVVLLTDADTVEASLCRDVAGTEGVVMLPPHLLMPHLTVQEQLRLIGGMYGMGRDAAFPERDDLGLAAYRHHRIATLPHTVRHILCLAASWLPDPDVIFMADSTASLSQTAKAQIWQLIRAEQQRRPRLIFYVTQDIEATRALADEVWLVSAGQVRQRWGGADRPAWLTTLTRFALVCYSAQQATTLRVDLESLGGQLGIQQCVPDPHAAHVLHVTVSRAEQLVSLMRIAGTRLASFRKLPTQMEVALWGGEGLEKLAAAGVPFSGITSGQGRRPLTGRQRGYVVQQVALSEWRRHFRSLWQGANVLLSNVLLLGLFGQAVSVMPSLLPFSRSFVLGIVLLAAAILPVGWGPEATSRWWIEAKKLDASLSFPAVSFPAWVDMTATDRGPVFLGILGGHLLILLCHVLPFWAVWSFAFADQSFLAGSYLLWGWLAVTGLALTALLARLVVRWSHPWLIGWGTYLLLLLGNAAVNRVSADWLPVLHWLPFTGLLVTVAQWTSNPGMMMKGPLWGAALMTILLWWLAWRVVKGGQG